MVKRVNAAKLVLVVLVEIVDPLVHREAMGLPVNLDPWASLELMVDQDLVERQV